MGSTKYEKDKISMYILSRKKKNCHHGLNKEFNQLMKLQQLKRNNNKKKWGQ